MMFEVWKSVLLFSSLLRVVDICTALPNVSPCSTGYSGRVICPHQKRIRTNSTLPGEETTVMNKLSVLPTVSKLSGKTTTTTRQPFGKPETTQNTLRKFSKTTRKLPGSTAAKRSGKTFRKQPKPLQKHKNPSGKDKKKTGKQLQKRISKQKWKQEWKIIQRNKKRNPTTTVSTIQNISIHNRIGDRYGWQDILCYTIIMIVFSTITTMVLCVLYQRNRKNKKARKKNKEQQQLEVPDIKVVEVPKRLKCPKQFGSVDFFFSGKMKTNTYEPTPYHIYDELDENLYVQPTDVNSTVLSDYQASKFSPVYTHVTAPNKVVTEDTIPTSSNNEYLQPTDQIK